MDDCCYFTLKRTVFPKIIPITFIFRAFRFRIKTVATFKRHPKLSFALSTFFYHLFDEHDVSYFVAIPKNKTVMFLHFFLLDSF